MTISPEEDEALSERPIPDVQAWECYVRARGEYSRFSGEGAEQALRHLENGLAFVGPNALLHAAVGWAQFNYAGAVIGAHEEYLDKAEESARKALETVPDSPRALGLLGVILFDRFRTE